MLLKITLDPSLDEETYFEYGVVPQLIYAEVSSVNSTPSSDRYELKQCIILAKGRLYSPDLATLSVFQKQTTLYFEWRQNRIPEIVVKVQVEECDRLPSLRNGG